MAHLAPTSVPLVISLNMTAMNLGVALAAVMGGVVVDRFGSNLLAPVSIPIGAVALVLAVWMGRRPVGTQQMT